LGPAGQIGQAVADGVDVFYVHVVMRPISGSGDFDRMPISAPVSMELTDQHRRYWRRTRRLTVVLLVLWWAVTFVVGFFARELDFNFFGWPFSFWVAAQGAPLVYVVIVAFYAWKMDRLDRQHGVAEQE
jgi:putative solute:sodium symporter small subunit